jgi:hypothetical protein
MLPEEGPYARAGVIARMAVIGHRITRAEEAVTARPVLAEEASSLGIAAAAAVLAVARTYATYATNGRPIEQPTSSSPPNDGHSSTRSPSANSPARFTCAAAPWCRADVTHSQGGRNGFRADRGGS